MTHGRILCADLNQLLIRTLQSFCDVNIRYDKQLQVFGSIHILADSEEVTSVILNEKTTKEEQGLKSPQKGSSRVQWSSGSPTVIPNSPSKRESVSHDSDNSPQGLPLARSILGRRAIRPRGHSKRFPRTPGQGQLLRSQYNYARANIETWQPNGCSTPTLASFDSGCPASEDYSVSTKVLIDDNDSNGSAGSSDSTDTVVVKDDCCKSGESNEADGNQRLMLDHSGVLLAANNEGNNTGSFDVGHLNGDNDQSQDEAEASSSTTNECMKLPSYAEAAALSSLASVIKAEPDDTANYDTLDALQSLAQEVGTNCNTVSSSHQETVKAMMLDFRPPDDDMKGSPVQLKLPDTPRPLGRVLQCPICRKRFISKAELRVHHSRQHRSALQGQSAFEVFRSTRRRTSISDSFIGMHAYTADNKYQCLLCNLVLKSKESFRNHMNSKHERAREYQCQLCNKKYFCRQSLYSHKVRFHRYMAAAGNSLP